jgi:hypothetical protein
MMNTYGIIRRYNIKIRRRQGPTRQGYFLTMLFSSIAVFPCAAKAGCLAGHPEICSPTINAQGQVGLTSYESLPFSSTVYAQSWGASPSLRAAICSGRRAETSPTPGQCFRLGVLPMGSRPRGSCRPAGHSAGRTAMRRHCPHPIFPESRAGSPPTAKTFSTSPSFRPGPQGKRRMATCS